MKGIAFEIRRVMVGAELILAQAAWDQFLQDALAKIECPNPNQRRDLALDQTIRALGQRPRAPLSKQQREDLAIQRDVRAIFRESRRPRRTGQETGAALIKAERFERLMDEEDD